MTRWKRVRLHQTEFCRRFRPRTQSGCADRAISSICSNTSFGYTAPVGLFGLISTMARVLGVIFGAHIIQIGHPAGAFVTDIMHGTAAGQCDSTGPQRVSQGAGTSTSSPLFSKPCRLSTISSLTPLPTMMSSMPTLAIFFCWAYCIMALRAENRPLESE